MTPADGMFEAARQLGEIVSAHRAAVRQATRDARNARRRARYAAAPPKPRPVVTPIADEDYEPFCRCYVVAPCSFCESGGGAA